MPAEDLHPLEALMRERIVVLDGAMGTMVQQHRLSEADYRGERFQNWNGKDLKGCLEILLLTKPDLIDEIHWRLLEAGADLLMVETIFDTLNAKAAIAAITELFEKSGKRVPLVISGTVTDRSGRILSGQTVEAFLISIAHAQPMAVGLNCALGPG